MLLLTSMCINFIVHVLHSISTLFCPFFQFPERPNVLHLRYILGMSEKIERDCQQLGVLTVFKSGHILRQSLIRVKAAVEVDMKMGVVYEVPCGECDHMYIGGSGRNVKGRIKEHHYAMKKKNVNNGITTHACQQQHKVAWDSLKVKCVE